ncbi:uncharacterized protein LOC102655520 isoform X3 [Apis mellifera]|uniref:Uncharacterized protein LOC102655520 isoform X3 n=1 Tax=Apis mellifera TaxID=7460 RepID=A0A7M7GRN9_APIME|nr:uncharacterized protein LOC102655520 isoform X3 [Apis mellifera]|eukprot:XP_006561053.1 uncharacterized protein LOC102655520 isoform X3 [Apis mellifera]
MRVTRILSVLAVAWLASGVKDHVAALNETSHHSPDQPIENEVSLDSGETTTDHHHHPHQTVPGKPTKLDVNVNQIVQTDDRSRYLAEATDPNNSTSPVSRGGEEEEEEGRKEGIVRLVLGDDPAGNASRIMLGSGDGRKGEKAIFQGKSSFLTGFGLGFLAFGLKKLLLPLIFGVQIIKSVLLALFLPSIIGSIGNIVGKGVSSFAQSSHTTAQPEENFEFKDNSDLYNDDYLTRQPVGTLPASAMYDETMMQSQKTPEIASRYSFTDHRMTHANAVADRYYTRHVAANGLSKKQDFKVFHEIPTSSLLLTNYDPFYSPLLSRLDAVFSRLGHTSEGCREYAVCAMYRSPARYAPYSNLVSAQLSRELNELRRPSSDNPDVLRFFRYMKAAKDGQDGVKCEAAYSNCAFAREDQSLRQNQAMLATYQDIDKLVHARKL